VGSPTTPAQPATPGDAGSSRAWQAYLEIRRRVTHLELAPGSVVTEGEFAEELGTSKTPIREALSLLTMEGYVTVMPRSGYRIVPVTLRDVRELFDLQMLVGGQAAALAAGARIDEDTIASMRGLAAGTGTAQDPFDAHTKLHLMISTFAGNRRMQPILERLLHHHERLLRVAADGERPLYEPRALIGDQTPLLDALAAGDADEAQTVAVDLLGQVRLRVIKALMGGDAELEIGEGSTPAFPLTRIRIDRLDRG
jgi:DNA-binding GntR family transcriptional regulator